MGFDNVNGMSDFHSICQTGKSEESLVKLSVTNIDNANPQKETSAIS